MMEWFRFLLGLPPGASTVADDVDGLHVFVISTTMFVSFFVFGMATWFLVKYGRTSDEPLTRELRAKPRSEILTIALVLSFFLVFWIIGFRQYLAMTRPPANAETIHVEAKQWMWTFSYPDGRDTNDVLTVPVAKPIALVMTSRDVIHSFFVPAFRVKSDVVPGRIMTTWFEAKTPGTYPIWCTEYCGLDHSRMLGEVVVLSPEDYAAWKAVGRTEGGVANAGDCGGGPGSCAANDLVARGREVAVRRACVACHTVDGQRHVGPTWKDLYDSDVPLEGGGHVVADAAYLTRSMMEPNADIVRGYTAVMPTYQGTLSAAEVGALVAFIRSLSKAEGEAAPNAGISLPRLEIQKLPDAGGTP